MTKLSFDVCSGRWIASLAIGALCVALTAPSTTAGPVGCVVITPGAGIIHLPGGGHGAEWHFHQTAATAILQCLSFNIGPGETARFIQPGSSYRVLTRTTNNAGININGYLLADQFVFFTNPLGITFGNTAVVNVGGIYAAAGDITNSDFINDNNFTFFLENSVEVMNGAVINAATAVHLIGQHVINRGTIHVANGVVTMLAGDTVTITEFNNGANVSVTISGGSGSGTGVINDTTGVIDAPGSQVILGAGDLYSLAVHHRGVLNAGNVTMFGDDGIRLDSNVTTSEFQTYEDAVTIGNDITLTAGQNATVWFQDTVDALAAGVQSLTVEAGTTDFDGNVGSSKALESLTVHGLAEVAGDVTTTDGILFDGNVDFDGDGVNQSVDAGAGELRINGDAMKAEGDLTLAGDDGIDLDGSVNVDDGSLTIQDDFSVEGDLTASHNITLMGDGTLDGAGNQRIDAVTGSLWAQESLTKTTGGNLTLGGGAGIRLDGAVDVRAGDLTVEDDVEINGGLITTSGDQTYEGDVDLGHDTLFEGDDILFEGAIHGHAFDLSVDADTTRFQDIIEAVGHLFVDGVTFIGGDITVLDGMEFGDAVILIGNADLIDLGVIGIIFRSTIDGPFLLFIQTGGDALFQGDIGVNQALAGFETDVAGFMLFDDAVFEIHSTGDVIFNQALNSVPAFATIGSTGHLQIFAANFTMGQNQKLTVLGNLLIDLLGGTAILGDINTLGDLIVNAGQIFLLSREPGFVIDAFGNIIFDLGLDFVAGGRFFFSVNPIVLGGGIVLFANPNGDGDALGTLQGFIMRAFGQQITPSDMVNLDGVFLDLTAQGPTNANVAVTIAGAVVRESQTEKIEQGLTLGATAVEELLRSLRISARPLTAPEEQALAAGRALFDDSGETRVDFPSDVHTILLDRMHPTLTQGSLDRYKQLAPVDAPNDVRDRLEVAWADYQDTADRANEATTPEGFVVYLVRVENRVALADLRLLDQVLQELAIAGPTRYELSKPRGYILDDFKPPVTQRFFQDVLEALRTMPEQGE